jgi:hypothetical protein
MQVTRGKRLVQLPTDFDLGLTSTPQPENDLSRRLRGRRTLSARGETPRLSQPFRRQRMGATY